MIPTYCQEDVIGQAIDSALAQDYPNLEIVISDDASPDNTQAVATARPDPRLRYNRNSINLGRVANYRHTLYHLATGDWVVNLDGDDYFTDPGFISAAMSLALTDTSIVIVSARRSVLKPGENPQLPTQIPDSQIMTGIDVLFGMPAYPFHFSHMAALYRRTSALPLDFYRMDVISADWESLYRLAVTGHVAYLDRIIGVWRASITNASFSSDWKARAENLLIWNGVFAAAEAFSPSSRALASARRKTIRFFSYLGFSDVLSRRGSADAIRYLNRVRKNDRAAFAMLLSDPRCTLRLLLSLLHLHPRGMKTPAAIGGPTE